MQSNLWISPHTFTLGATHSPLYPVCNPFKLITKHLYIRWGTSKYVLSNRNKQSSYLHIGCCSPPPVPLYSCPHHRPGISGKWVRWWPGRSRGHIWHIAGGRRRWFRSHARNELKQWKRHMILMCKKYNSWISKPREAHARGYQQWCSQPRTHRAKRTKKISL